jgi:outer membrane lipoprotein-sorting protein
MSKIFHIVVCVIVLAGYSSSQVRSRDVHASLNGEDIMLRMAERYNTAKSYQDTGLVQIRAGNNTASRTKVLNTFSTYFARPGSYRFQWKANSDSDNGWKVIWSGGDYFSTLNANGERELEMDRGTTIARAAAVTRGASQTVAALLSGTVRGFRLSQMSQVTLISKEEFDGVDCYVVRGHHPLGFAIDIWVGKSDFLIRKIRQMNGDGSFQEEIRRNIILDVPIPQSTFEYKSPKTAPKNVT